MRDLCEVSLSPPLPFIWSPCPSSGFSSIPTGVANFLQHTDISETIPNPLMVASYHLIELVVHATTACSVFSVSLSSSPWAVSLGSEIPHLPR
ncbi:hypothetical protein JAAARDRAFT_529785 [Jaapia argillacea MUCL 33604]|uniref:Uncharacterized protein n=1 Tax=Jaapia argillacea MUCL 33604 TaxID=933084 RepID=A0A067P9K1_9AGAM|nr:hypothetical protein JAAARDRAFT_529785 [Jaapia argillacea MUCL 33604]